MYKPVPSNIFVRAFGKAYKDLASVRDSCSSPDEINWGQCVCYLEEDSNSGYAIRNGYELICVFSRFKGRGGAIVQSAINNGAESLDCFDGYLTGLYSRHGFVEYKREPNWTEGEPDVVYMYIG